MTAPPTRLPGDARNAFRISVPARAFLSGHFLTAMYERSKI
jgi:hypothetical protein